MNIHIIYIYIYIYIYRSVRTSHCMNSCLSRRWNGGPVEIQFVFKLRCFRIYSLFESILRLSRVANTIIFIYIRYPSDDWHLAHTFSLVYFSVEVWLVGVFPHSVSTRPIPASGSMHPSRWLPPLEKTQFEQGWPGPLLGPSEGAFELTYGSACIIGW